MMHAISRLSDFTRTYCESAGLGPYSRQFSTSRLTIRSQMAENLVTSQLSLATVRQARHPARRILMLATIVATMLLVFSLSASAEQVEQTLMARAQQIFDPIPDRAPQPDSDFYFEEKVDLGLLLFFDPRLSQDRNVSCHSCHNLSLGGADGLPASIGHSGRIGSRNSPTVFNSVFQIAQFWDGRARTLFEQAAGPMTGAVEMATSDPQVCHLLSTVPGYVELFENAFPDRDNPLCFTTIREAIAAFESTLITPNAPFDQFLKGDSESITAEQKKGLALFLETGCSSCHMGLNIGGNGYYKFGVKKDPAPKYRPPSDHGRQVIINTVNEDYVFKSPSLRNVALTAPYFHSGSAWLLTEAITVMADTQLDKALTPEQQRLIANFLQSLTGQQPQITLPVLPVLGPVTPQLNQ